VVNVTGRVGATDPLSVVGPYLDENGHCSVLVKLTNDADGQPQDLLAAHTTWWDYAAMHRMYKTHRLHLSGVATTAVTFSSYPGYVASVDDWYRQTHASGH
jgi:hypothetical protein